MRLIAVLLSLAAARTGPVQFWTSRETWPEGDYVNTILLVRDAVGNVSGNVTATVEVLPGSNATSSDLAISPDPVLFAGDVSVRALIVVQGDNQVYDEPKVLYLALRTTPPGATGALDRMEIWIQDDGDGGVIWIQEVNRVEEVTIMDSESDDFSNATCAVWAERIGTASGAASLLASPVVCKERFPEVRDEASNPEDWMHSPQEEPLVWEDGELGRKCIVGLLTQDFVVKLLSGTAPTLDLHALWIIPDGQLERDESLCYEASLVNRSTATLSLDSFQVVIRDTGTDGAGRLRCVRGVSCTLDLMNSTILDATWGMLTWVQPSTEKCVECFPEIDNASNVAMFQALPGSDGNLDGDLGMQLLAWNPGTLRVCECWAGDTPRQVASMVLAGPQLRNTGICVMSNASCILPWIEGIEPSIGRDHMRIFTSCRSPNLTGQGMSLGGQSVLTRQGYVMSSPADMRRSPNGVYELCWCRESSVIACDRAEHFLASAGTFIWAGPNILPTQTNLLGGKFILNSVHGTALQPGDKAMLLENCGQAGDTSGVIATLSGTELDFGHLTMDQGFRAGTYQLCWCTVGRDDFQSPCNAPQHFLANFGELRLICDSRSVDLLGDGVCRRCPLMIQEAGGPNGMDCVISPLGTSLAFVWFILLTMLFLALFGSLRVVLRQCRCHGSPRYIEDISTQRGKLMIRTAGFHNLMTFKGAPIPVTLHNTGHFLLDSRPGKKLPLHVLPRGDLLLEVVQKNGEPVEFSADSSMGSLRTGLWRSLLHSKVPKTPCILLVQLVVLAFGAVALPIGLNPTWVEGVLYLTSAVLLALLCRLTFKYTILPSTRLQQLLKAYTALKVADANKATLQVARGPQRGIRVWKLLELHEHFQSVIADRNMYYLDPNIIRPLTAKVKLSFAEYVGPDEVEWFVSHWWGTKVNVYCDALKRHATEVLGRQGDPVSKANQNWQNTAYWICTFSNNQYRIGEELGESHTESSFFLALHSPGLKGTCMLLDEKAMPLARSWCLFELLQTIELEEKSQEQNRPFAGLLFCTSNGVLNYGSSTVEMSMQIGERLLQLSLSDAQASTEKDKTMIAELVQKSRGSFEEIDTTLRVHIRDALKECQNQVNKDFTSLFERLPKGAPHAGAAVDDSISRQTL